MKEWGIDLLLELLRILKENFASLLGALISGLIAIYIFKKGISEKEKRDLKLRNEKNSQIERFFFKQIESNIEPLEKQIQNNENLIKLLEEKAANNIFLNLNINLNFSETKSISSHDIFLIFIENNQEEKSSEYIKIRNAINTVENYLSQLPEIINKFNERYIEFQENFGQNVEKIQNFFQKEIHRVENEKIEDNFITDGWKVIVDWYSIGETENRDVYIIYESYLKPLRQVCGKHHTDDRKPELLEWVLQSMHYFDQIDYLKKTHGELFTIFQENLTTAYKTLSLAVKQYQTP